MATTLILVGTNKPYTLRSLGVRVGNSKNFEESTLFPIGTEVELTSGKFPMTDYMNMYRKSKKTHVIGGKTVRIEGFTTDCEEGKLNKYGGCKIHVIAERTGGTRRGRGGRRSTRRRY